VDIQKQFSDPMIDNKTSKSRYRADNLIEEFIFKLRKKKKNEKADEIEGKLSKAENNEDYFNIIMDYEIKTLFQVLWTGQK
jgi:glycyl-tRNA synthetase